MFSKPFCTRTSFDDVAKVGRRNVPIYFCIEFQLLKASTANLHHYSLNLFACNSFLACNLFIACNSLSNVASSPTKLIDAGKDLFALIIIKLLSKCCSELAFYSETYIKWPCKL